MVIYLTVDEEVIRERLQKRGLNKEQIQKRLTQDKEFWQKYGQNYDFVIENKPGKLDQTVEKVIQIINETAQKK